MLLAVDVGNTQTVLGLFEGERKEGVEGLRAERREFNAAQLNEVAISSVRRASKDVGVEAQ